MNFKGCRRKLSCPDLRYYLHICLMGLRKATKSLRLVVSGPRFEPRTSGIRSSSVNCSAVAFSLLQQHFRKSISMLGLHMGLSYRMLQQWCIMHEPRNCLVWFNNAASAQNVCGKLIHYTEIMCVIGLFNIRRFGKSRGSSVSTIFDYGLDGRGSIPDREFFLLSLRLYRLWDPPSLLYNGYRGSFLRGVKRSRGVMLTTHTHLVPRLRMSRSFSSSPPKAPPWRVAEALFYDVSVFCSTAFLK
jgi:hypothetical protein